MTLDELFDTKNLMIATLPSSPAIFAMIDSPSTMTIVSGIVLPIVFFIISKTADVLLKIHFENKKAKKQEADL